MKRALTIAAVFAAGAANAQMYECWSNVTPGMIYQQNVPCPAGTDARRTPEQEKLSRQKLEAEQASRKQRIDNEMAALRKEVRIGMTAEQVQLAWGGPQRIVTNEGGGERWVYYCPRLRGEALTSTRVYFRNGQVTTVSRAC
jgi:hypothetical protein